MEPVVVLAQFLINEDKIEEFIAATSVVVHATNQYDEGCVFYNLHQDTRKKTIFFMIEKWESMALLEKHLEAGHTKRYFKEFAEFVKEDPKLYFLSDAIFNVSNNNTDSNSKSTFYALVFNEVKKEHIDQFIGAAYPCIKGTNAEDGC